MQPPYAFFSGYICIKWNEAMGENRDYNHLPDVESCNEFLGVKSRHPYVNIIDFSKIPKGNLVPNKVGVYAIMLHWYDDVVDGEPSAHLYFQVPCDKQQHGGSILQPYNGWLLIFSPELVKNTLLSSRLHEYPFFSDPNNNIIHLHYEEMVMIQNCMRSILEELSNNNDKFSERILAAGIAVILNISMRYYEREYCNDNISPAKKILLRLNQLLSNHLLHPTNKHKTIPTVASCAHELNISPNYLGDAIRKSCNITAQEYIRSIHMREAKHQLQYSQYTIAEIAYNLGFKYPHHLTRVFKKETGETPVEYRKRIHKRDK